MASVMEHKRTCRESISIKYNEKGKNPFSCATKRQGLDGMDNGWKIRWAKRSRRVFARPGTLGLSL